MEPALPAFRFHPDPVQSGSIERSDERCRACGRVRGFIYTAGCYCVEDLDRELCPWCIADGTAHAKFDVTFHDMTLPAGIEPAVAEEIEQRTPGFDNLNPFDWPECCGSPMAYGEPAGIAEIRARHPGLEPQLLAAVADRFRDARRMLELLRRDGDPCAHVFSCPVCGGERAIVDST